MAFNGNAARFLVNGLPSEDANGNRGVVVANGATITLQLEVIPSGALSATFQLFDPTEPSSPLASLNAPAVNFTGSGTPLELLTDPDTQVAVFDFPAVGIQAYLVRCTVATSAGPVVFERCVVSRGASSALRKTFPAESQEFESRGWSDELNRMVDAIENSGGGGGGGGFLAEVVQQNVGVTAPQIAQGGSEAGVALGLDLSDIPAGQCAVSLAMWLEGIWADNSVHLDLFLVRLSFTAGGGDPGTRIADSEETTIIDELQTTASITIVTDGVIGAAGNLTVEITDSRGANGALDVRFTASRGAFTEV